MDKRISLTGLFGKILHNKLELIHPRWFESGNITTARPIWLVELWFKCHSMPNIGDLDSAPTISNWTDPRYCGRPRLEAARTGLYG